MSNRITRKHVEAQVDIVNRLLGHPDDWSWKTDGAVVIGSAYGGYAVHRYTGTSGGVTDLMGGYLTLRDASRFLSGMIAALRIAQEG